MWLGKTEVQWVQLLAGRTGAHNTAWKRKCKYRRELERERCKR